MLVEGREGREGGPRFHLYLDGVGPQDGDRNGSLLLLLLLLVVHLPSHKSAKSENFPVLVSVVYFLKP